MRKIIDNIPELESGLSEEGHEEACCVRCTRGGRRADRTVRAADGVQGRLPVSGLEVRQAQFMAAAISVQKFYEWRLIGKVIAPDI